MPHLAFLRGLVGIIGRCGALSGLDCLGRFLVVSQSPSHADAIIVLGGGDGSRQYRQIEIFKTGLAPPVISSREALFLPDMGMTFAEVSESHIPPSFPS